LPLSAFKTNLIGKKKKFQVSTEINRDAIVNLATPNQTTNTSKCANANVTSITYIITYVCV